MGLGGVWLVWLVGCGGGTLVVEAPDTAASIADTPVETGATDTPPIDTAPPDTEETEPPVDTDTEPPSDPGTDTLPDPCAGAAWTTDLPLLLIETGGQPIQDSFKITAGFGVVDRGEGQRNCPEAPPNGYAGEIGIEIRGSTSQQYPKKSYGFETRHDDGSNRNAALLGLPSENDWVLYAPYTDKSLVRNVVAYGLFESMGRYAARTRYAELFVNGDYEGLYVLVEKVKVDGDRVAVAPLTAADVDEPAVSGGYVIKVDKTTGSGDHTWASPGADRYWFQAHDPPEDELAAAQLAWIEDYTLSFEAALDSPAFADPATGYAAYADPDALVDFLIMQELGRTVDGYRSSTFLHKDRGGRLVMGPIWDFNLSFGNADYCDAYQLDGWQYEFNTVCWDFETQIPPWWGRLLQDPAFTTRLKCRWEELRAGSFATAAMHARVDAAAAEIAEAQARNFDRWDVLGKWVEWNWFVGDTWEQELDYLRGWLADRAAYMDSSLPGTCP